MAEETVLLRVGIDPDQIESSTKAIIESRKELEKLMESNKELIETEGRASKAYIENEVAIKRLNGTVSSNLRVLEASQKLQKANSDSIVSLRENVKRLNDQYINLSKTERNSIAGKDIQKKIRAQTDELKKLEGQLGQTQRNVGNYGDSLNQLNPALGGAVSGFQGMIGAAKAFIATPIGSILAAVAAVVGTLAAAFGKSEKALDTFEDIMSGITATVGVFLERVSKVIEIFIDLTKGNISLSEAVDLTASSFDGLGKEIEEARRQTQLYLNLSRDLEDAQFKFRKENAATETQIKALEIASKNRNLSLKEQEEILLKAINLEKDLVKGKTELANTEAVLAIKQTALEQGLRQSSEETFNQFVDRVLASGELSKEQAEVIVSQIEKLEAAKSGNLAFEEKLQNQLDAIEIRKEEAFKKEQDRKAQLLIAEEKAQLAKANKAIKDFQSQDINTDSLTDPSSSPEVIFEESKNQILLDLQSKYLKTKKDGEQASAQFKMQLDKELMQSDIALTQNALGSLGELSSALGANAGVTKAIASAETAISTYQAAQLAFQSQMTGTPDSPIRGAIAAASAIVSGLARLAKINSIQIGGKSKAKEPKANTGTRTFEDGGEVATIGGNLHSAGGTTFQGTDGTTFEAERGEKMFIVNRSSSALLDALTRVNNYGKKGRGSVGRNYFADGGFVSRNSSLSVNGSIESERLNQNVQAISQMTIVTKVSDIDRVKKDVVLNKAISSL